MNTSVNELDQLRILFKIKYGDEYKITHCVSNTWILYDNNGWSMIDFSNEKEALEYTLRHDCNL